MIEAALNQVPEMTGYTDESIIAVYDAIEAVEGYYPASKQTEIDAMAKAINDAVAALKLKADGGSTPIPNYEKSPATSDDLMIAVAILTAAAGAFVFLRKAKKTF